VSQLCIHHSHSLIMQHHSPFESRFEYFPPTPPLSDSEATDKAVDDEMANLVPHTAGQQTGTYPGTSGAPSKVTLSLGNLPSKKDFKAPWPRTPSKVGETPRWHSLTKLLPPC
jgi:hypothetical protein